MRRANRTKNSDALTNKIMAAKDRTLVAIVLCIKELPELCQQEARFLLGSGDF